MYKSENLIHILTILESIEKILIYTEDLDNVEDFFNANDQLNFNATQILLLTIGEESKKIEEDLKLKYDKIEWKLIANFRNRIAHDYRGVNPDIIFEIIIDYLPEIKSVMIEMLKLIEFNEVILIKAIESKHYKHLKYLLKVK